ncbi:LLM class flavin-dependent oxidoreductase, partial [Streptomyces sp. SB3404]|nr:LLM class flavin-dependent oxidoreductase [Streptomyces boncukensis]
AGALAGIARRTGADELLLTLNTYDPADRLDSYRRLARVAGLTPVAAAAA